MMHDPVPSINLLQQDHSHQLMGKSETGETDRIIASAQNLIRKAKGTADDEDETAFALDAQNFNLTGQFYGVGHSALESKGNHKIIGADLTQQAFAFCAADLRFLRWG